MVKLSKNKISPDLLVRFASRQNEYNIKSKLPEQHHLIHLKNHFLPSFPTLACPEFTCRRHGQVEGSNQAPTNIKQNQKLHHKTVCYIGAVTFAFIALRLQALPAPPLLNSLATCLTTSSAKHRQSGSRYRYAGLPALNKKLYELRNQLIK